MAARPCDDLEYERAITALNGLQKKVGERRETTVDQTRTKNERMHQYLTRVGLTVEDLNQLRAIHVAGTKGKGSVCALCESILRAHGLKTGFYSSPHLLEVRERIRISGRPLSKAAFVSYFWKVFEKLDSSKQSYSNSMPGYFRFLTVMAFTVFLQEKVDVAVVEVGLGGAHDSTNLIPEPVVCAICSLGYDHMESLGASLAEIAWHKGGIFKRGRPAFTLPQPPEAMEALLRRAHELKVSSFQVVPPLSSYPDPQPEVSLRGKHQGYNASLAVQVCHMWLKDTGRCQASTATVDSLSEKEVPAAEPFHIPDLFRIGLQNCVWAGRNQVVRRGSIAYYLDGAHTPQSVVASAEWFCTATLSDGPVGDASTRILLFNITRKRDPKNYLPSLVDCQFQYALFCPNLVTVDGNTADQTNLTVTTDQQVSRCYDNEKTFKEFLTSRNSSQEDCPVVETKVFPCISHALRWMESLCVPSESHDSTTPSQTLSAPLVPSPAPHIAVLVTGSLHLVGAVMNALGFTIDDV